MKLNPPGSSSDLAAARAIARRLHQRAFASKAGSAVSSPPDTLANRHPARRTAPPPLPPRPVVPPVVRPAPPPDPERLVESIPRAVETEEQPWSEPRPRRRAWTEEPEPPGPAELERHGDERWADASPVAHTSEPAREDDVLAELTGGAPDGADLDDLATGGPSLDEDEVGAAEPSFEPPGLEEPSFEVLATGAVDDGLDLDAPAREAPVYEETSFEEPVPSVVPVSPEDLIGSPTEELGSEGAPLAPEFGDRGATEDLVEVAGPSWDDVTETSLTLAGARGAMLVAASGEVLSARGEWPNPGPEAIAGRLVVMMERALRAAPTRSVSAPLAGQHLTAWRVPVADGLHTVVFIGDFPLKADVRAAIDDEIRQAAGV